ncbi:hypothetical protein P152DRAFT_239643 [Eremomyces bilateralis CBS 781.70]|uniref:Zinc metalloprotease-like protein n=1 Tax=Eremomyces bilateralis CBS 781.70 TaxID=1392243 RepID=A0A6G1GA46_9PEZI|nr:uncharacterized protein P152DRAFT_239643 [Eremomyces bilateralis CBS 781.70]KAF1814957.1 hypothetical protein P152DRAFT_239643 [Eremomyces bilateralis CBS 781.70]
MAQANGPGKTHFKKTQDFKSDYAVSVKFTQYESERTGMRVFVVDQKGPKVYGYFAVATEIHDDSGAPHTLEHLIFMGSKSYRYKGLLDKLATRAYSMTNAWTGTDQTVYTLESAGWDGTALILPVYLEHVLLPTLTDAGCYTEVHHIDGTGQDAGVVYCEMQDVQNKQSNLMSLEAKRLLYPEGNGFRYETGGMMEQLRVLTAQRIRDFHKEMYQPKNLRVILVGDVNHDELLGILEKFEDSVVDEVPKPGDPFKRPWVESAAPPPLSQTSVVKVEFPEEDESMGEIVIAFFGPGYLDDVDLTAMNALLLYIAGSPATVLENVIVEKEQLASGVYYESEVQTKGVVWFTLTSVETEKLGDVEKRFFELLKETAAKPFDMKYMKDCLVRLKRHDKRECETNPSAFSDAVISDHLFGDRQGEYLKLQLSSLKTLDDLDSWSDQQWRDFLTKYLAEAHHVSILGVPSATLSEKLKKDEQARVEEQQQRLGEEGLKELTKKLDEAKAENDRKIPDEIMDDFKIPGTESIKFIPTTMARSGLAKKLGTLDNEIQKTIDADKENPLFIHFEHIPSNFVQIVVQMGTTDLSADLKPLVSLYLANLFTTPVMKDGKRVEFEQVITMLEEDTASYHAGSGFGNGDMLRIELVVEPEKYVVAIEWLKTLLFDSILDVERLKTNIAKILADIPDEKRSGWGMLKDADIMIHFNAQSLPRARSTLAKGLYLKRIKHLLNTDPDAVVSRMKQFNSAITQFCNMRVAVIADVHKLKGPVSSWETLTAGLDTSKPLNAIDRKQERLSDAGKTPGGKAFIVPMPPIDSSFAMLTGPGPDSYAHPDLPALMVAMAYLDTTEGPIWANLRGTGLVYGANFSRSVENGLMEFSIYRSPDAFNAYAAGKKVVDDFVSGKTPLEQHALEACVSTIVLGMADEQPTMGSAAMLAFVNEVIRGVGKEWSQKMLGKVRTVGKEDVQRVMGAWLAPLFNPKSANLVVTCASINAESLKTRFEAEGFAPEVQPLKFFEDDYGLKGDDLDDEDEEDEEDEEDFNSGKDSDEDMEENAE